jgi:hypothetical protein
MTAKPKCAYCGKSDKLSKLPGHENRCLRPVCQIKFMRESL